MKRIRIFALFTFLVLLIPVSGYALADIGVYGGYTFYGKAEISTDTYDSVKGYNYGAFGHLSITFLDLFSAGFGMFIFSAPLKYKAAGEDLDVKIISSWGFEGFFQLGATPEIHPYIRAGFSVVDKLEYDWLAEHKKKVRFLGTGIVGLGLSARIFPLLALFGEYLYTTTHLNHDHSVKGHSVNLGVKLVL